MRALATLLMLLTLSQTAQAQDTTWLNDPIEKLRISATNDDTRTPSGNKVGDWWLVGTTVSYHSERSNHTAGGRGYNEHNFGVGVEYQYKKHWRLVAGEYENSYYKNAVYAGAAYTPWHYKPWNMGFGVSLLAVTGYRHAVAVIPMPVISVEGKRFGINIGIVPTLSKDVFEVIGLQVKVKLTK